MNRYILGFLISVGLIILIIVLMFSGHSTTTKTVHSQALTNYSNSAAEAEMTIYGPITAAQNHYSVQIIIGQNKATFNEIQGYDNDIVSTKSYANSLNGYQAFLAALDYDGFTLGNNSAALKNSLGYCSTGNIYTFELTENGKDIERYWATNCASTPRTFEGNLSQTISLFEAQIPNYSDLDQTSGLN